MSSPAKPKSRTVDVRAMMARGQQPFPAIMRALETLGPDDSLLLITPFLPSPLIEKLQSEGYIARPERRGDGSWQTHFSRTP